MAPVTTNPPEATTSTQLAIYKVPTTDADRLYGSKLSNLPPEIRQKIWTELSVDLDNHSWDEAPAETSAICGVWNEHKLVNLPPSCFINKQIRHDAIRRSIPYIRMHTMSVGVHGVYHMRHTMRDLVKHMPGLKKVRLCLGTRLDDRVDYFDLTAFYQFCEFYADKLDIVREGHYVCNAPLMKFWTDVALAAVTTRGFAMLVWGKGLDDGDPAVTAYTLGIAQQGLRTLLSSHASDIKNFLSREILEDVNGGGVISDTFSRLWLYGYRNHYAENIGLYYEHPGCRILSWKREMDAIENPWPEPWIPGNMHGAQIPGIVW